MFSSLRSKNSKRRVGRLTAVAAAVGIALATVVVAPASADDVAQIPVSYQVTGSTTVATGTVLDAAINDLDEHAGTAKILASVEITIAKAGAAPSTKRNRFAAQLTRTDAGWKLSALDQVPVGAP